MAKIFFSGIAGSGMSAIASFMADKGHTVAGSDRLFDKEPDNETCAILKAKGITIFPQDGSGINIPLDFAVFSTAVEDDQPEKIKAKKLGIPMKTRTGYLRELTDEFRTIAVAGTSGKSTTAGMLAFLMNTLGLKPNLISGGRVKQFKTKSNPGNSLTGDSDLLVIEACESDGSIVYYHPLHSIIANLSLDHNPIDKTKGMFEALSGNTKEIVVINGDDFNLRNCSFDNPIRFSIDTQSEYRATTIEYQPFQTVFQLHDIPFKISLPGRHNLYNALSCIALLSEIGISLKEISKALPLFSGLDRRFDIHFNDGKYLVIDDYAHNPDKISCLMQSMKNISHSVCYIFQPHGFGPTRLMKQGYIKTFINNLRDEDNLFLLPIYYAGGTAKHDISSEDLFYEIKSAGKPVEVLHERSLVFSRLKEWNTYVIFGARDETLADFAEEIAEKLK
jgi:UDP-N-acetylmuramate--alanine ligase